MHLFYIKIMLHDYAHTLKETAADSRGARASLRNERYCVVSLFLIVLCMFWLNETINKAQVAQRSTFVVSLSIYPSLRCSVCLRVKRVGMKSTHPYVCFFRLHRVFKKVSKTVN